MMEYKHICKSETEVQSGIRNLRAAGYHRTENCYWVEWYEKEIEGTIHRHVIVREF